MTPSVSVVIPMYNSASTVGATISSFLTQTYPDLDIIVVDDGSTDDSRAIAETYGDRITLVSQENGGVSKARNTGVGAATSDLVLFCDADDFFFPPYVENLVKKRSAVREHQPIVYANTYFMRLDGVSPARVTALTPPPKPHKQRLSILQGNFATSGVLLSRRSFETLGGFDESLRTVEDWDFWVRSIFAGHRAFAVMRPQGLYRWAPGSLSANSQQMLDDERSIFVRLLQDDTVRLTTEERRYVVARLEGPSPRELRFEADLAVDTGDYDTAARLYRQAARLTPGDLKLQARRWTVGTVPQLGRVWRRRQDGDDRRY